jgi:hypothetical protein
MSYELSLSLSLRRYDTRKTERYEVPYSWTEEVSLTLITAPIRSTRINNFHLLPAFGMTTNGQQPS